MDYIERERHRLEIDLHVLTRRWHGTLSRMFVLRGRLDGIDPTDAEAFSRAANTLGAFANDATSLKRCVDKAKTPACLIRRGRATTGQCGRGRLLPVSDDRRRPLRQADGGRLPLV